MGEGVKKALFWLTSIKNGPQTKIKTACIKKLMLKKKNKKYLLPKELFILKIFIDRGNPMHETNCTSV